jgi:photosystem II stability/assembly factor-like uncharacterized protein
MKNPSAVLRALKISFVFGILWLICTPDPESENQSNQVPNNTPDRKFEPNDHFWQVRAFPDSIMDIAGFHAAMQIAREQEELSRNQPLQGFEAQWRLEGPVNIAGRVNTIAVHPKDRRIIYAGCATGGLFKSLDRGDHWIPIFDHSSHLAIGHMAIDPQNPEIIYVGTGDRNLPGFTLFGNGVWKSVNGGATWTHIGLSAQRVVSKIIVHPEDGQTVYVATMGLTSVRNQERGLYKTTDGGNSWTQILFVSEDAGIIDLLMNPENPDILYAAGWNRFRSDFESVLVGDGARIYKTINGGDSWTPLTGGLPDEPMGRIGLTMSGLDPDKLYATYVDTNSQLGTVYRTLNGGTTWDTLPTDNLPNSIMGGFGW